ncbi:protein of unknown function [Micromonospora pattaloongensis]|uniref:DUF4352 domain-containing protein n=1 Tax=Micromonospora pattaloongensis TaxID=405436 RepID=A0A1H3SH67_9ACTN|nr:DUF4352 domain-containing protein [Micromonospora pattaloongensis]SDZ36935.1 protein of unknown function [Micromonospora pattaloongensis]
MTTPDPTGNDPNRPRDEPAPEPPSRPVSPAPPSVPDWSTPDTPTTAPRIGGNGAPPPYSGAGPPPYTGPVPPYPPPPPPGRNGRLALILGIVAALLLCCCAAATITALTWGRRVYDQMRDQNQRVVGLNDPARDGQLEFRVRQVHCGIGRIGDQYVNQTAVGQFCLVELTVRNLGSRPAQFNEALQTAYAPGNRQFRTDPGAGVLANADQQVFLDELNPGREVTGAMVYDIPPDAQIVKLELHSTPRSKGVLVRTG